PLPRAFFERPVTLVARELLGAHLVRRLPRGKVIVGRIVEVEAYDGPEDRACHAWHGRTPRTEVMFGPAGHAYVYFVYGLHHCLHVVTGPVGYPAAVLVRAAEPAAGARWMDAGRAKPEQIASGPGRLARAFQIDLSLNRADLCSCGSLALALGARVPDR